MADPGFPVGGRAPVRRGRGPPTLALLVKMYAKTKELGPIGRACAGHAPPRSANGMSSLFHAVLLRVMFH